MSVIERPITRPKTREQEQVEEGAAWLDEYDPGWDERINLAELELNDCKQCVVGQLFGDYYEFLTLTYMGKAQEVDRGFFADGDHDELEQEEPWARLTEAWRDEIASRR